MKTFKQGLDQFVANLPLILVAIAIASLIVMGVLFVFPPKAHSAEGIVISTGSKTGNYFKVGNRLQGITGGQVLTSKGSVENMDNIMTGKANIALVQMDAYAQYMFEHPEAKGRFEIIGPLYEECVYLAANTKGKVQSEDDLQSSGVTIAVGDQGSGTAVTWDYMRQLEPGYKDAAVSFSGGVRALGKLASKPDGEINAVMWVSAPDLDGKLAQTVLNNPNLKFLAIDDKDLNDDYATTGQPIYKFKKIKTSHGVFGGDSVETICVDAVLIADSDIDEDVLEQISDIVMNYHATLVPKEK